MTDERVIINNQDFDLSTGMRLLKTKYGTYESFIRINSEDAHDDFLQESWDSIEEMTFAEIAGMDNIEKRRVGFTCYGLERLIKDVNPKLIDRQVIKKQNKWLLPETLLEETKEIDDVYELYEIDAKHFGSLSGNRRQPENQFFVKCWCTSTNREYVIWVNKNNVEELNNSFDAVSAIAWTFTTNIKPEDIQYIIRQGDMLAVKVDDSCTLESSIRPRHITKKEYLEKLVYES
jgi:hypothetical protein